MRVKNIYILILVSLLNILIMNIVEAQDNGYDELIKDYLIKKGEIDTNEKTSIYSFEILKSNSIKENICGIYRVGTFSDHGLVYLFLLDKKRNEKVFLDYHDLSITLEAVIGFLDNASCKFSDSEKLNYMRKVIEIYRINEKKIPW